MPMVDMPLEQLKQYRGTNPKPDDFDAYWAASLAELDGIAPEAELVPAAHSCHGAECFDLYYTGTKGARIHAKYLRPTTPGPHPCLLVFHGYTLDSGDWSDKLPWVMQGFCVAAMDCRGQGGLSQDVGGVLGTTCRGHIVRGLEDTPANLLYRDIMLDTVQLQRVVAAFAEVDAQNLATAGASQGGGLSTACAALAKGIRLSFVQYPFLSDYQRVWQMDLGERAYAELAEFFRKRDPRHERAEEFFTKLGYIDIHHLAPRIRHRVLFATGLMDKTCPPSTQFAVFNNLGGEKELYVYPDFAHEPFPGWLDIQLKAACALLAQ